MRAKVLGVALVFIAGILAPMPLTVQVADTDSHAVITCLSVCHAGALGISPSSPGPAVISTPCVVSPDFSFISCSPAPRLSVFSGYGVSVDRPPAG